MIVRGHVVVNEPRQHVNHIDLDTGCYQGGWLTAGILDDTTGCLVAVMQTRQDGRLQTARVTRQPEGTHLVSQGGGR
jgi:hypothetical protein